MDLWVCPPRSKAPSWIWIRCIYSPIYRNTFMSPQTFAMSTATQNSAISFLFNLLGDPHSSLLQRRTINLWLTISFLSLTSNTTFALTVAMQILHRHLAALFHLYSAYLFPRPLFLTPKSTRLQTTGWTPNASSSLFNCFFSYHDNQHKVFCLWF